MIYKAKDFAIRVSRKCQETRALQGVFEGPIYRSPGIGCDDYKAGCCNSSLSVGLDLVIAVFLVVWPRCKGAEICLKRELCKGHCCL